MKVLQINIFGNLSTGRIAVDLFYTLRDNGHDGMVAFARNTIAEDVPYIRIGSKWSVYMDGIMSRITDKAGFYSRRPTKLLIEKIKEYDPDIIHLHNLHGYYVNVELLFGFLKEYGKPVVWTLHDCWSFTGHCCNFESAGCEKWKGGCHDCGQQRRYPASLLMDRSAWNYQRKKELFTGVKRMVLVSPSDWLKELVTQSYMGQYPVEVIRNGVDLHTFHPTAGDWVGRNKLTGRKLVLGVAGVWTPTKGLDDLIRLSETLNDDYRVVAVGVSKKQKKRLPEKMTGIERTYDSRELAEIYTAAHVLVNPTYDDNFPNVNLEALACGTPVITYKTGGSAEAIDENSGAAVKQGDLAAVVSVITRRGFSEESCIARSKNFQKEQCYSKYIELYQNMCRRDF